MQKLTYEKLLKKITKKENFSFARYGDGEWNAIFKKQGANCDKHQYFPDMGKRLKESLAIHSGKEFPYYFGMQSLAMRVGGDKINKFITETNLQEAGKWSDADILHKASIEGQMLRFFEALNTFAETLIFVAPAYIRKIENLLQFSYFVEVPEINCWKEYDIIRKDTENYIKKQYGYTVVLFSAGMPSNVLISDLYKKYGDKITMIDTGSVLDPFVGRKTRLYHESINIPKINKIG